MSEPLVGAMRFGWGLLIGAGLGLVYGFLRPLRRRHCIVPDLIFLLIAFYGWLVLSFGICRGDIRLGTTVALPVGMLLWEWTVGRLLRPVFFLFWKVIMLPFRKIIEIFRKIIKKVFAYIKKWVTIGWNHNRRKSGGEPLDR